VATSVAEESEFERVSPLVPSFCGTELLALTFWLSLAKILSASVFNNIAG
jgi:hypothetical protein